jgi:hypothetical protein
VSAEALIRHGIVVFPYDPIVGETENEVGFLKFDRCKLLVPSYRMQVAESLTLRLEGLQGRLRSGCSPSINPVTTATPAT